MADNPTAVGANNWQQQQQQLAQQQLVKQSQQEETVSQVQQDDKPPSGCKQSTDVLKMYLRSKIVDANLQLSQAYHDLSLIRQLVDHKMKFLKEGYEVIKQLNNSPRYITTVESVVSKDLVKVKFGSDVYILQVSSDLDSKTVKRNSRVGVEFTSSGGMQVYRVFPAIRDPLVTNMLVLQDSSATYEMIGGLKTQILAIREVVELPIAHPELFEAVGISQPKGVLLYGPPGTGKTLLARAVAHHTKCSFFRLSGTELCHKILSEGPRLVRELFQVAREKAPSIVFMDEIDSIGALTSNETRENTRDVLLELLNQIDGFEPCEQVKIIVATNRIDDLDSALIRAGRIDRKIEFPPPDLNGRVDILRIHSKAMNLGRTVNLRAVADKMPAATGAELRLVCQEAALGALRAGRTYVIQQDFMEKVDKVMKAFATSKDMHFK